MSKISISAAMPVENIPVAKLIHDVLHLSYSSAINRLKEGKEGIFYTTELYLNDHVEKAKEIRTLLAGLASLGIELFVMEIAYSDSWENVKDFGKYRIATSELVAMLDNAEGYE